MKHKDSLVIMTALVPTIGHKSLIDFASRVTPNRTNVVIFSRSFEPVSLEDRLNSLREEFKHHESVSIFGVEMDHVPQNPEDHIDFWDEWKRIVLGLGIKKSFKGDYFIASEKYGKMMAKVLNMEFVPYDINRTILPVKGTRVRENIIENWNDLVPSFQKRKQMKYVMFGNESIGKTTIGKLVSEKMNGIFVEEWVRPYLEVVGSEINQKKMEIIFQAQKALQENIPTNKPIVIHDTDLYSTIGYQEIYGTKPKHWAYSSNMTYFLLPDDIPFVPDVLRYGGDKRETEKSYWEKYIKNNRHFKVPSGSVEEKVEFICNIIKKDIDNMVTPIANFMRLGNV